MGLARQPSVLRLAVSPGISSAGLAGLLALHREEEPHLGIQTHEAPCEAVAIGLSEGRYDIGLTWRSFGDERSLCTTPLWQEELALALPARSPLLIHATIPLQALKGYELLQWCSIAEHSLEARLAVHALSHESVGSFELLATLVAAGYGIGIAPLSRIVCSRTWGIVMRPFALNERSIQTNLVHRQSITPAIEGFALRARMQWRQAKSASLVPAGYRS